MPLRVALDKAGRLVIPKPVREELRLAPGDEFELESDAEEIVLRPLRRVAPVSKERGVWVFRVGQPLTEAATDAVLREVRDERDSQNLTGK